MDGIPWIDALPLPPWAAMLIVSVYVTAVIGFGGFVFARAGRSPIWALALLVPVANVAVIWWIAYCRWPRLTGPAPPRRS